MCLGSQASTPAAGIEDHPTNPLPGLSARPQSSQQNLPRAVTEAGGGDGGRPRTAPQGTAMSMFGAKGVSCDWCGCFCGQGVELELEQDMPASVQRALDSTEFAGVALNCPTVENMLPGPQTIPDVPAPKTAGRAKKASEASLGSLKTMLAKSMIRIIST